MRLFSDVASRVEDPYLRRATELAEQGRGSTAPNPMVGCVVVRDGRIVGEGFHARAGGPHAEVSALEAAGEAARGADVYVTLEPCSHHGRTPPCTDVLLSAGVARVVIGMSDPTSEAGGGAEVLEQAGVTVEFAPDLTPFAELNDGWLTRTSTTTPRVAVKLGLSLDAKPALALGQRASITGSSGAEVTRILRSRADAVLVGAATAAADDPALTLRGADGVLEGRQPLRVVLARFAVPSFGSSIFNEDAPTLLMVPDGFSKAELVGLPSWVSVSCYPDESGLLGSLKALGSLGINDLLVEPGPRLFTAFWRERRIDDLVTVVAGGVAGPEAPALYLGESDGRDSRLSHLFRPYEAGIVGDVSVTSWRRSDDARS